MLPDRPVYANCVLCLTSIAHGIAPGKVSKHTGPALAPGACSKGGKGYLPACVKRRESILRPIECDGSIRSYSLCSEGCVYGLDSSNVKVCHVAVLGLSCGLPTSLGLTNEPTRALSHSDAHDPSFGRLEFGTMGAFDVLHRREYLTFAQIGAMS